MQQLQEHHDAVQRNTITPAHLECFGPIRDTRQQNVSGLEALIYTCVCLEVFVTHQNSSEGPGGFEHVSRVRRIHEPQRRRTPVMMEERNTTVWWRERSYRSFIKPAIVTLKRRFYLINLINVFRLLKSWTAWLGKKKKTSHFKILSRNFLFLRY